MKNNCNCTLGYCQVSSFNGDYSLESVSLDESCIVLLNELKTEGTIHNFCPTCGESLTGALSSRIKDAELLKETRIKEHALAKQKEKELFEKAVLETSIKTKLNLLPAGSYNILFHPTSNSYSKDIHLSGFKEHILINCVHNSRSQELTVKEIIEIPILKEIQDIFTSMDWQVKESGTAFVKKEDHKFKIVSYLDDGMFYVSEKTLDKYQETITHYDRLTIKELGAYLGTTLTFKTIKL